MCIIWCNKEKKIDDSYTLTNYKAIDNYLNKMNAILNININKKHGSLYKSQEIDNEFNIINYPYPKTEDQNKKILLNKDCIKFHENYSQYYNKHELKIKNNKNIHFNYNCEDFSIKSIENSILNKKILNDKINNLKNGKINHSNRINSNVKISINKIEGGYSKNTSFFRNDTEDNIVTNNKSVTPNNKIIHRINSENAVINIKKNQNNKINLNIKNLNKPDHINKQNTNVNNTNCKNNILKSIYLNLKNKNPKNYINDKYYKRNGTLIIKKNHSTILKKFNTNYNNNQENKKKINKKNNIINKGVQEGKNNKHQQRTKYSSKINITFNEFGADSNKNIDRFSNKTNMIEKKKINSPKKIIFSFNNYSNNKQVLQKSNSFRKNKEAYDIGMFLLVLKKLKENNKAHYVIKK